VKKHPAQKHPLPAPFVSWAKAYFGAESPDFLEALEKESQPSVRPHPIKHPVLPFGGNPVPWWPTARVLDHRPQFALDPLWHAGAYYVQDPATMLIGYTVKQLQIREGASVLDLCAAPGGKSTLLLDALPEKSLLISNEVIKTRFPILLQNLERWGDPRAFAVQMDPAQIAASMATFDLVLVDAPCSGEGLFRKDHLARAQWSEGHVRHCALRQERILQHASKVVKPGGFLVYSTCTYNHRENFDTLTHLIQEEAFQPVKISHPHEWGVTDLEVNGIYGAACYPHKTIGEGFFYAVLQKNHNARATKISKPVLKPLHNNPWPEGLTPSGSGFVWEKSDTYNWTPDHLKQAFYDLSPLIRRSVPTARLGSFKGSQAVPHHSLSQLLNTQHLPDIEVDRDTALAYLRKNPSSLLNWSRAGR
jgi:16S rRNA C967 or C1407 C5-methylase (RsmB/RsmF family)